MKLAKNHFSTVYNALGYSPGSTNVYRDEKLFVRINPINYLGQNVDRKIIRQLNKLHPCFGVKRIIFR